MQGALFWETAEEWLARFERAEWVPPPGSSATRMLGWRCPDCGVVEPNDSLLGTNHGWHPHGPRWIPFAQNYDGRCIHLKAIDGHRIYSRRKSAEEWDLPVGARIDYPECCLLRKRKASGMEQMFYGSWRRLCIPCAAGEPCSRYGRPAGGAIRSIADRNPQGSLF